MQEGRPLIVITLWVLCAALAACGGGSTPSPTLTPSGGAASTVPPAPTDTPVPGLVYQNALTKASSATSGIIENNDAHVDAHFTANGYEVNVKESAYEWTISPSVGAQGSPTNPTIPVAVRIAVDFHIISGHAQVLLLCRGTSVNDSYQLYVDYSGAYAITKVRGGNVTNLAPRGLLGPPDPAATVHVEAACKPATGGGTQLALVVDGSRIAQATDSDPFLSAKTDAAGVVVATYTGGGPAAVRLSNLSIYDASK